MENYRTPIIVVVILAILLTIAGFVYTKYGKIFSQKSVKNENHYFIFEAIESNDAIAVKNMLENNPKLVNEVRLGFYPLHIAVLKNNLEIIKLLINNKADINKQDYLGNTALHIAALNGNIQMVKLLVNHKANKYLKNSYGFTPIQNIQIFKKNQLVLEKRLKKVLK